MKKMILGITAVTVMTASLCAGEIEYKTVNPVPFNELKTFKSNGVNIKKAYDNGSIYIIKGQAKSSRGVQNVNGFVTKDMKVVVLGSGFYTNSVMDKVQVPVDMKTYKKEEAYTYGNGPIQFYLFTDPECPFCARFESQIQQYKDDATFHVFFFPLSFHKHSISMTKHILSQKTKEDKQKALEEIAKSILNKDSSSGNAYKKTKYSDTENKELDEKIKKMKKIAIELGVQGTPTIFNDKGYAVNWTNLKNIIKSQKAETGKVESTKEVTKK